MGTLSYQGKNYMWNPLIVSSLSQFVTILWLFKYVFFRQQSNFFYENRNLTISLSCFKYCMIFIWDIHMRDPYTIYIMMIYIWHIYVYMTWGIYMRVKFIEMESRVVVARDQRKGNRELLFSGYKVSSMQAELLLTIYCCTTLCL